MHYRLLETPIGIVGIAWTETGLARLQLPERDAAATERRLLRHNPGATAGKPRSEVSSAVAALEHYLAGEATDFASIVLDLDSVGEFHRDIYSAARTIGWGKITTYGALARMVGSPDAARAVGQAMGRNPVPIIIPCHRVLAAGNGVGGFSAFGGANSKRRLLALEGVQIGDDTPLLPGFEKPA